jgi:hypothetical protein
VNAELDRERFDPELDNLTRRPSPRYREPLPRFQRLVVNPLLAVLCWLMVFFVLKITVQNRHLVGFLVGVGLLFLPFLLVQYHCMDCGKTGWVLRYRRHACPPVIARWQTQQAPQTRGPNVKFQLVLWSVFFVSAFVLAAIAYLGSR